MSSVPTLEELTFISSGALMGAKPYDALFSRARSAARPDGNIASSHQPKWQTRDDLGTE